MLKYGIDDIRLLFENDIRFLRQFKPILAWKKVGGKDEKNFYAQKRGR
jgi:hypothetical protein